MEVANPNQELTYYSERNSVEIDRYVQELFKEPEVQLTTEEEREVYEFAHSIYDGQFRELERESSKNLEELASMSPGAFIQEFYISYFLTPKGQEDLIKMGVRGVTKDEIVAGLRDIESIQVHVNPKERKKITKNSFDWYKEQIVAALETDKQLDEAYLDDDSVRVNYNPAKLLEKMKELAAHRKFYRQVKVKLKKEEDTSVKTAKMLELEMNMARTNEMAAGLYDDILELGEQLLAKSPNDSSKNWVEQIEELKPVIYRALTRERIETTRGLEDFKYSLARRTDHLMQGVAWTEDGISPISNETIEFAKKVIRENESGDNRAEPIFSQEIIEKLKQTNWNAEQFKTFCADIIENWGILSEYQADWSEAAERDTPAEDYKWQVIIDPQIDSIKINRTKKLLRIPETFDRNLIESLTIASHELTHLAQAESDSVLAQIIPLAAAGGRRITGMREGGAVDQETKTYTMLGIKRPTRVGYLAALQVKLSGANLVQVAREFYDAYEDENKLPEEDRHKNRKLAADRALRLYRNGGYNSQPLDYIEGELTKQALSKISPALIEPIMIAGASFSLHDYTKLHKMGLYNAPTTTKFHPAEDVMRTFQEQYLEQVI